VQTPAANRTQCAVGLTTVQPATGAQSGCVPDCQPGFYSVNGTEPCTACGSGYWCEGGPQPTGIREACPVDSFTLTTTSSSAGQCQTCAVGTPPACTVTTCEPGFYAASPGGACVVCGVGFTCPGGPQTTPLRTVCPNSLVTLEATASSPTACIRVCEPGYFAASPTSPCQLCLSPYYCAGGSQADGPVRSPCPQTPDPFVTLTSAATSQAQCVITCSPGQYSPDPAGPECVDCGIASFCAGGPQQTAVRTACNFGLTTLTTTATSSADCLAYECPPGLLPIKKPPLNATDCGVVKCDPCGSAAPDLYMTGKLGVYVSEDWTTSTAANTASLLCSFDKYDPLLCAQTSTSARDTCTTNDIAIDGAGNFYVLGRTGGKYATSGWIIKIDADQTPGEPCAYEMLLQGIEPYAGLGAAPNSNLLYATGSGSVLTLKIEMDGTLSTVGQLAVPSFTGAGDITAGPNGTGKKLRGREREREVRS